jgi:hypothetical protein
MIVVQNGGTKSGQWGSQSLDLVADYRKVFGRQPPDIIGIALMADTDNTGEQAPAYYGDILLKRPSPSPVRRTDPCGYQCESFHPG